MLLGSSCCVNSKNIVILSASRYARNFLPLGQHGITKVSQTQFYHLYGPIGTLAVCALPAAGEYFLLN